MTIRAESSILEFVVAANGVAIAAPFRGIANSSCRSHLLSVVAASCLLHGLTCTRKQYGARKLWPVRLSPTRPPEVIDFEEFLSELPPPRIKTGQCYADLWGTLAYPVKSTCKSTTPLLSERAGGDARL